MSLTLAFSHILTHTLSFLLALPPSLTHKHTHTRTHSQVHSLSLILLTEKLISLQVFISTKKLFRDLEDWSKIFHIWFFLTSLANNNNNTRDKSMISYLLPNVFPYNYWRVVLIPYDIILLGGFFTYAGPVLFQAAQLGIFRIPSPLYTLRTNI